MKKLMIILMALGVWMNSNFGYSQTINHHKYKKQNHSKKNSSGVTKIKVLPPSYTAGGTAKHNGKGSVTMHRKSSAKRHSSKIAKRNSKTTVPKITSVDSHSSIATVEIKNGSIYVNDAFVSKLKSLKNEDQKIIIDYIPPAPLPTLESTNNGQPANKAVEKPERPMLGVHMCHCYDEGAVIDAILPFGPADDAGLFPGDVITKIDDREIDNPHQFIETLDTYNAGDEISVTYKDDYGTEIRKIKLAEKEKAGNCDCFER